MRKTFEAISLGALAVLWWITWRALAGPGQLPGRIPTHFNAAGEPNAWGPPGALWLLPVAATGLYLFISLVALFPAAFNFPVRVTPVNRPLLEALTLQMIGCLKAELACLFLYIQWAILVSVRNGRASLSPLIVPLFLVAVFANIGWHMVAVFRAARARTGS
ncbi:MAG TPA: DUF1648 domain-containing protein [Terracidiphilus sp.]|nr:DUF1648 domain-containing protein [Terracidiphilus sp.]